MHHALRVEPSIEALAASQFGVFSRAQAITAGVTRSMRDHRVNVGAWAIVLPNVHRVTAVPRTKRQNAMASALWSDGFVSHVTAAELWGLEGVTTDEVHVTVPSKRRPRNAHVVVHRVVDLLPADIACRGPIADANLVIEYDSDQWHSGTIRRHLDAARRNQLRTLGWTVVEVTPATLREPRHFLTTVETVLAA